MVLGGVQEGFYHDGPGDFGVGGEVEQVAGVVVDEVQDLHAGAVGQGPVGEVGLPHLIGLGGCEASLRGTGPLMRFRDHGARSA